MQNLSTVIKLLKKLTVKEREWMDMSPHGQIINHTLEQQGVQKVIKILERLDEGDPNLIEIMKNLN